MRAPIGIGDRVLVLDAQDSAAGPLGTVIATDDAGHYYVGFDNDPSPNHDKVFRVDQLALAQASDGHAMSGAS